jgi:cytochrome c biogenesis protein CcmG/thiol:disulfide interchange protein DsbE
VLLLLLVGAGWAMWGVPHGTLHRVNPRPTVGEPAPEFRLQLLDGGTFSLTEQRGEVVVVNLWTSWCEPCQEELPDLQALWEAYGERGVRFVGVAHQDEPEGVRDAVADYGLTYPVGLDEGQRIADAYGITGVPETFVVAPDGRVAYVHVGPVTAEALAAELDALLEEAP